MAEQPGDQRVRKRVTTPGPKGKTAVGTYSISNPSMGFCNKHYITVLLTPGSSAGSFSIRGEPAGVGVDLGTTGFTKIEIENVNIATATCLQFEVAGFFDAFALIVSAPITGTSPGIGFVVNSTIIG
jgi:hypothetical protein